MSCRCFETLAVESTRNSISGEQKRELLLHVESCADCAERLDGERELAVHLNELRAGFAAIDPPVRLDATVRQLIERAGSGSQDGSAERAVGAFWLRAAAVLFVLGVGLFIGLGGLDAVKWVRPEAEAGLSGDSDENAFEFTEASDFIQIGGCRGVDCWQGAEVVRITLPRSSMRMFGLPVNEELIDSRVAADVLIGHDGTARAIRFIH